MDKKEIKEFIDNLRETSRKEFLPAMRKQTTQLLVNALQQVNPKLVLEIGTCLGVSALTVLNETSAFLTTIEIDEKRWLIAKENFCKCGFSGRYNAILGNSNDVLELIEDEYDFVIMDGAKGSYKKTFLNVLPILKKGGIIFIDDVDFLDMLKEEKVEHKHRTIVNNMREFLAFLENEKSISYKKYNVDDGVIVVRKKDV